MYFHKLPTPVRSGSIAAGNGAACLTSGRMLTILEGAGNHVLLHVGVSPAPLLRALQIGMLPPKPILLAPSVDGISDGGPELIAQ